MIASIFAIVLDIFEHLCDCRTQISTAVQYLNKCSPFVGVSFVSPVI